MHTSEIITNRCQTIEKHIRKPGYLWDKSFRHPGVQLFYRWFGLFCLAWGIGMAFGTLLGIEFFTDRWHKSGLFICIGTSIILNSYRLTKDRLLQKHKERLEQLQSDEIFTENTLFVRNEINFNRCIRWGKEAAGIILGALGIVACVAYLGELQFWLHFDIVVFFVWSGFAVFYQFQISRLKALIREFEEQMHLK